MREVSSLLSTCWGHPPQKLGVSSYSSAVLGTKDTYYPRGAAEPCFMFPWKKPCEDGALEPIFPLPSAAPSTAKPQQLFSVSSC